VFDTACSSPQSLSNTDAETVFDTACSSLRGPSTGSWSLLPSLETGPMRPLDAGSRELHLYQISVDVDMYTLSPGVVQSTGIPGHEHGQSTPLIPSPPPPNASNRKVGALLLGAHYRKERLLIEYSRCARGKETLSYSAKLAQEKALSSTQSHKPSSRRHLMTHIDAHLPLNATK
jgi:hypothetical protein